MSFFFVDLLLEQIFDSALDFSFRKSADGCVHYLTLVNIKEIGDAHDVVASGSPVLIGIHLAEFDFACVFFRKFFNDGRQHPAGTAPWGPEVYYYRDIGFQYFCFKSLISYFNYHSIFS